MSKNPKLLRQFATLIIGAFVIGAHLFGPTVSPDATPAIPAPSAVSAMFDQHSCWRADGRTHPAAHHAVVVDDAGRPAYVGPVVTDRLISALLFGEGSTHGLDVIGFCR